MTLIADRDKAHVEAQRKAEGRRRDDTPLRDMARRITRRAKGKR